MTALAPPGARTTIPSPVAGSGRSASFAWMALPALVVFVAFGVVPLLGVVGLSFTTWDGLGAITPSGLTSWTAVLTDPGTVAETTCRLRSAAGEWRWMQTQVHNRLDDRGVRGVVVTSRDVHERHLLEQRMGGMMGGLGGLGLPGM